MVRKLRFETLSSVDTLVYIHVKHHIIKVPQTFCSNKSLRTVFSFKNSFKLELPIYFGSKNNHFLYLFILTKLSTVVRVGTKQIMFTNIYSNHTLINLTDTRRHLTEFCWMKAHVVYTFA